MRICWIIVAILAGTLLVACPKSQLPGAAPPPVAGAPSAVTVEPDPPPPAVTVAPAGRTQPPLVIEAPALGSGVIRVPSTMKQGREAIAQLIVTPSDLAALLRQDAVTHGPGDVQASRAQLRLTPRMRASLLAPGFDVNPKEVQEQAVKIDEPTVWLWTLVPSESGARTLVFTLEGTIVVDGKETSIRPPALQVPVRVDVDPLLFFGRYWQWLMTAIVIPLAVFVGKRWLDRRAASKKIPA